MKARGLGRAIWAGRICGEWSQTLGVGWGHSV